MSAFLDVYDDQHEEKSLDYTEELIPTRKHSKVTASGESETPSTISPFTVDANEEIFDEAKENNDEYYLTLQSNSEFGGCARGRGKITRGRGGKCCPSRNLCSLESENYLQASSNGNNNQYMEPKLIQTSCLDQEEVNIMLGNLLEFFYCNNNNNEVACNKGYLETFTTTKEELRFFNPCVETMKSYQGQMNLKLQNGYGEARYIVGLGSGLQKHEMFHSLKNICLIASELLADVLIVHFENASHGKIAHLLIRSTTNDEMTPDIKIMLLGDTQSGKSTLVGVLTSKQLDDGNGLTRTLVHSHKHEMISGETSTLNIHMISIENDGNMIALKNSDERMWVKSVESGAKVLTFFDVGGSQRNSNKVLSTIASVHPDYAFLVISAIQGVSRTSQEHIRMAMTMKIPLVIILTHTDLVSENYLFALRNNIEISVRKFTDDHYLLFAESEEDNLILSRTLKQGVVIPVFKLSNVNGKNLNLFKTFLTLLPVNNALSENASCAPTEFHAHTVFKKEKQTILAGTVRRGCLKKHQILMFGPDSEGKFRYAEAQSIRCKNVAVKHAYAGQTCTVEIKLGKFSQEKLGTIQNSLKHGIVLVDPKLKPAVCREFVIEVAVRDEEQEVVFNENYEPVVISESIRQVCNWEVKEEDYDSKKLENHKKKSVVIQPGQTRLITLRFKYFAEYLSEGQKIVIDDNCVKCVGTIRKLMYDTLRT